MWSAIAISYCLICWLVAFFLVRFIWRTGFVGLVEKTGIPSLLLELVVILMAPLFMPCLLSLTIPCILNLRRQIQTLNRINRTYRPYEFVKVNNLYLDASIRELFEWHTPSLIQLGFNLIGDYRMKPEPVEVHDRLFFSADGEILGTICALLDSGAMSLISVLEDGTCVHTCSVRNPHPNRTFEPDDRLVLSYLPDTAIEDMYRHHLQVLGECTTSHETGVLRFREDQFREVMIYDQLIFCRWRYRYGGLDQEPPAPNFDSLRTRHAVPVP